MAGRPSKAKERRAEILDAMESCVREHGIAQASMRRIAEQSGLSLQMVSHYFGNRDALVLAFIERITERIQQAWDQVPETDNPLERLESHLDFLFSPDYKSITGNDVIGREIWAYAERNEDARQFVWSAYEKAQHNLARQILMAHPNTPIEEGHKIAYAVLCLTEANEFFSGIGATTRSASAARDAAAHLLSTLG